MTKRFLVFIIMLLSLSLIQANCTSVPHLVWPQGNIGAGEINEASLGKGVLVASRSSEFKDAIVERIKAAFTDKPVYVRFIGVGQLEEEDGTGYDAVVLINTCMGWNMDRHVKAFLDRHGDQSHMIVLTTSGDGNWLPKMEGRNFDAISSASQKDRIKGVSDNIIDKVTLLLQEGQ
jgi:hypothetical protein